MYTFLKTVGETMNRRKGVRAHMQCTSRETMWALLSVWFAAGKLHTFDEHEYGTSRLACEVPAAISY